MTPEPDVNPSFYAACGYRIAGGRAIRIDMLDRLAISLARAARSGSFELTPAMLSLVGLTAEQAVPVLGDLGYSPRNGEDGARFVRSERKRAAAKRSGGDAIVSPFAKLQELGKPHDRGHPDRQVAMVRPNVQSRTKASRLREGGSGWMEGSSERRITVTPAASSRPTARDIWVVLVLSVGIRRGPRRGPVALRNHPAAGPETGAP